MSDLGYDFYSFYDDASAELPVPAVFAISANSDIIFAGSAGGDYRERVGPADILDAIGQ